MKVNIPAVIRGQVLQQHGGYLVRGSYVVGHSRKSGWFWYDTYNHSVGEGGLESADAALAAVAAHVEAAEGK